MQADYIFTHATVVTMDAERRVINDGAVAVKGDSIAAVGPTDEVTTRFGNGGRVITARGKAIFPGLINTHNHLFQTLLKGLGDDRVLSDWLAAMTFPSAVYLKPDDTYHAAMLGCLDGLHSGTTTMVDYMYAHNGPDLSDGIIAAFRELGIRAILGRGTMNTAARYGVPAGIQQDVATFVADFRRLVAAYHGADNGRLRVWLAPAAVWSNNREMFLAIKDLLQEYDTGLMIHVSETPFDREATVTEHGANDIETLRNLGLLGPRTLMVHCVYLTPREIRMARDYDARVSHNPVSNMYLSSGVAPVPLMLASGMKVGLATDGAASNNSNNMLETLKFAALLHKVHDLDPTVITAEKVLEMATIDGARALGLEQEIGSLEAGKKADLFVFDPQRSATATPMHHPVSTLVYSADSRCVEMVMVDGRVVMEDGRVTTVNEREQLAAAATAAQRLAERAGTIRLASTRPWRSVAY